jgi:hypothetical protein
LTKQDKLQIAGFYDRYDYYQNELLSLEESLAQAIVDTCDDRYKRKPFNLKMTAIRLLKIGTHKTTRGHGYGARRSVGRFSLHLQ